MPPPPGPASSPAHRLDLRRQPVAPGFGGFNRLNVILEHDMMHRVLEAQTREP